jgi:hypothetical protein
VRRAVVLVVIAIVAGCAAPQRPQSTSQEPMSSSPQPSPRPSLEPGSEQPAPAGESLAGVLGADSVEGGCSYLQAEDGTRYEVIYPDGWRVQLRPLQLLDAEGAVVAEGGDEVTVRGSAADDMASICQIGPIFQATEVDR